MIKLVKYKIISKNKIMKKKIKIKINQKKILKTSKIKNKMIKICKIYLLTT